MAPRDVLEAVLKLWPNVGEKTDTASVVERMGHRLSERFDSSAFRKRLRGVFNLSPGILVKPTLGPDEAKFIVCDSADPDYPHLAVLTLERDGKWRLTFFDSMCPSCFATGIVPETKAPCGTCGASGWGAQNCETL